MLGTEHDTTEITSSELSVVKGVSRPEMCRWLLGRRKDISGAVEEHAIVSALWLSCCVILIDRASVLARNSRECSKSELAATLCSADVGW